MSVKYKIYCSNWIEGVKFDYPILDREKELFVKSPKLIKEVNALEQLTFTIYPNHPNYSQLFLKESVIKVYQDNKIIFKGKIVKEKINFDKSKNITCEGALATLVDNYYNDLNYMSKIDLNGFVGDFVFNCNIGTSASPVPVNGWFEELIINFNNENNKPTDRIQIGEICPTVPKNDVTKTGLHYSYKGYGSGGLLFTYEDFKNKTLLEILELIIQNSYYFIDEEKYALKYYFPTYDEDNTYLNLYTEDDLLAEMNNQDIVFGENLIDLFIDTDVSNIITAILPSGAVTKVGNGEEEWTTEEVSLPYSETVEQYENNPDIYLKGNYMYSKSGVDKYGWLVDKPSNTKFEFFDKGDMTTNQNYLKQKGSYYLQKNGSRVKETITIKAADLAFAAGYTVDTFEFLKYVIINAPQHLNKELRYLITRVELNLLEPEQNKITFNQASNTMTGSSTSSSSGGGISGGVANNNSTNTSNKQNNTSIKAEINDIKNNYATNEYVSNVQTDLSSYIDQQSGQILASVKEDTSIVKTATYYQVVPSTEEGALLVVADDVAAEEGQINIRDISSCDCGVEIGDYVVLISASQDYEAMKQQLQSLVSQTSSALELNFLTETVVNAINVAAGEVDSKYNFVNNYFRFTNEGELLIGTVDNPFVLKLSNDRISFLEDNVEVAYISNNKLYITNTEILNSLDIGGFSFTPRANGNLSFR